MPEYAGPERRREPRTGPLGRMMDALYGAIRWIGGHVRGFYSAIGLFLVFGLALALLAIGLFALIARVVAAGAVQQLDTAVVAWISALSSPLWDTLALIGAAIGSGEAAWIVIGIGTIWFWRSGHHYSTALLWVSLGGAHFLSGALKAAFERPRPTVIEGRIDLLAWSFQVPTSPSFPSGHALTSVVIFGTIAYLVARLEPTPRLRRWTFALAAALILLIGLSRIYLGVHYPSDVLAGYLAGFVWASFAAFAIEVVRYFVERHPQAAEGEKDLEKGMRPVRDAAHRQAHG